MKKPPPFWEAVFFCLFAGVFADAPLSGEVFFVDLLSPAFRLVRCCSGFHAALSAKSVYNYIKITHEHFYLP